jgi:GNAT superfamily N-acetyltransferase
MIRIRQALAPDRKAVCRYLHDKMNQRIPIERWRNYTSGRWAHDLPEFGVIAEDDGRMVGFLGVVYAKRVIAGQGRTTGNLGAFFVERDYRGRGLGLDILGAIMARDAVTYTTFSSNPPARRLVLKAGMELLDDRRLLWHPGGRASTSAEISSDVTRFADRLPAAARQALSDHADLGLQSFVICEPDGSLCLVILYVKLKGEDIAYHEVLHISDSAVFGRHVRAFAAHVLPSGRAVLSVDSRFLVSAVEPDAAEEIVGPRYFRPAGLAPAEVDFLYSETVLLGLKLY